MPFVLVFDVCVEAGTDAIVYQGAISRHFRIIPVGLTHLAAFILCCFEMFRVELSDNVCLIVFKLSFQVADLLV